MAADQERADRIRALKQERPDLTWRRIADHVGVTERSATDWQKKGGIEYDNAKKLAAIFEVDVDYLWRGTEPDTPTPSPFSDQDNLAGRLDALEERLERIETLINGLGGMGDDIIAQLDVVERALRLRVDQSAAQLDETLQTAVRELQSAPRPRPAAPRKTAPSRTR